MSHCYHCGRTDSSVRPIGFSSLCVRCAPVQVRAQNQPLARADLLDNLAFAHS